MPDASLPLVTAAPPPSAGMWTRSTELPGWTPPARWPGAMRWLKISRGNALRLFPADCYRAARSDHRVLGRPLVVLNDPAAVAHVLGRGAGRYGLCNLHKRLLGPAFGGGLIVAEGAEWVRQRRQAHSFVAVATRLPPDAEIGARIDANIDRWAAAGPVDPAGDLSILAIELVALMIFQHRAGLPRDELLAAIDSHRALVERVGPLDALGAPAWLRTPRLHRARSVATSFDARIEAAIADPAPGRLALHGVDRDFVVSLLSGFESVSAVALWALGIMAQAPGLQAAIRAEGATAALPTGKVEAGAATLLDAAMLETMRLYPPLPMIFRTALADDETPAGRIARNSLICLSPWLSHRAPTLWDDPLAFRPSRHLHATLSPAFLAFGTGVRRCVGARLGRYLIAEIVSRVLARCSVRATGPLPLPRAGVTLRPDRPIRLVFEERADG